MISNGDADPTEPFFVNLGSPVGGKIVDFRGIVSMRDCVAVCRG